jgi:hypothetical protein
MGHLGAQGLDKLPIDFTERPKDGLCICDVCITQKGKRKPHNHSIEPGKHPMELVYSDVVGPIPIKGFDGSRFFVTFMCDKTKLARVYVIKSKGEVTDCFIHFKRHFERSDKGWLIKRLRDDNGGEYVAGKLHKVLKENGIDWEPTEPYSPEMNGPSERLGQTIWRKAAPLLKRAGLDFKFWPEAVKHACYLYLRSHHSAIQMSPFESWYGKEPNYDHIKTFGSIIYYHNPGRNQKGRDETVRGILVGYEGDTICRILKPDGRIARGASIREVERFLWDRFAPEDKHEHELRQPMDHFTDPTKPSVPVPTSKLASKPVALPYLPISMPLPDPNLKRKRLMAEDWFIDHTEPVVPSRPNPNLLRSTHLPALQQSPAPSRAPIARPMAQNQQSSVSRSRSRSATAHRSSSRREDSPVEFDRNAFWPDSPPPREPQPSRAVKRNHSWRLELDLDLNDEIDSPSPSAYNYNQQSSSPDPIEEDFGNEYQIPSATEDEFEGQWQYLRHPHLRRTTPIPSIEDESDLDAESDRPVVPPNHPHLRKFSDSLDPISLLCTESTIDAHSLFLLPSYLASHDEHSLLSFLGHADPNEPFEPRTLEQAMNCPQWKQWEAAIRDEYMSLVENSTWTEMKCPGDRESLTGKWVFKIKRGAAGEILRYKARWVVRGFEQREGIDFHETFASVVKPMSYKAIFALAAANDWEIDQMDVKTAFLYGEIDTEVYIDLPTGCGVSGTAKLNKALYGLKQSPRVWYNTFANFLSEQGFKPLDADSSVFCREGTIIAIYVDDLLITGDSRENIDIIKKSLSSHFHMSDLGPCHFYLGMEVIRDRPRRSLRLSQTAYLRKVLEDNGMSTCSTVNTPMEPTIQLLPADKNYQAPASLRRAYQSAVGSLMYAMLGTRPDIAFAVSVVSRFASNPTEAHMKAVKRIFRYIQGTLDMGLVFRGSIQPLEGYTDSDWAGDHDTRRSTSGYVFNVGSAAISWSAKRQPTVSLSSCEAEYIGQTNATKEAIWLQGFLKQVNPGDPGLSATIIYGDNQGAIALAKNPQFHARTKHIDIQHHFVREKVAEGRVDIKYIHTSKQVADGLTKALPRDPFQRFRKAVGVE